MRRHLRLQPRDTWTALIVKLPYHLLEETLSAVGESGCFGDEEVREGIYAAVGDCLEQLVDVPRGLADLVDLPPELPDPATLSALAQAPKGALCAAAAGMTAQMIDELCDDTTDPVVVLAVACHAFELSCRYSHLGSDSQILVDMDEVRSNLDRWVSWCEEANKHLAGDDALYIPVRYQPAPGGQSSYVVCEQDQADSIWDLRQAVITHN